MAKIDSFLKLVVEQRASDLHFVAGSHPIIRYNGDLVPVKFRVLNASETRRFLYELMTKEQQKDLEENLEIDFAYRMGDIARFRVNVFHQFHGLGSVFRVIPSHVPTLKEIGMPESLKRFAKLESGLVLITGPTGSGKSTTLAALINEINENQEKHIITIEDPIEFVHKAKKCVISQRQVGTHTITFGTALRATFRESPDVILVGEMRDNETISLAITAATTGCLVFGTLHTNSASKTIDRIIDSYPEEQQEQIRGMLSMSLKGVVSQQLLKKPDGTGRIAALEVLTSSYALSNLIRENKTYQIYSIMQTADYASTGMETMDHCLVRYVERGLVTVEEALYKANEKVLFDRFVQ